MAMMHSGEPDTGSVTRGGQIAARDLLAHLVVPGLLPCSLSSVEDAFVVNEHLKSGTMIGGAVLDLMSPELPRYLEKSRMSAPIVVIVGHELKKPGSMADCFDELEAMGVNCNIPFVQGMRFLEQAVPRYMAVGQEVVFRTTDDEGRPLTASFCRSEMRLYAARIAKPHKSRMKVGEVILTM